MGWKSRSGVDAREDPPLILPGRENERVTSGACPGKKKRPKEPGEGRKKESGAQRYCGVSAASITLLNSGQLNARSLGKRSSPEGMRHCHISFA